MSELNSTDDDRLNARVDAILTAAFPLAASPDFPIGPIPLFKIRNLLLEAAESAEPNVADSDGDPDGIEDGLWRIDALLNAISALVRDRDFEIDPDSIQRLLIVAGEIVHNLLPEPCE